MTQVANADQLGSGFQGSCASTAADDAVLRVTPEGRLSCKRYTISAMAPSRLFFRPAVDGMVETLVGRPPLGF
jgi:hypothetical protein